jgi:hypothetical protein
MENRTGIPDLTQMGMVMDIECVLLVDATLHDLNEGIDLALGEGHLKCDFCKFKLCSSLEWTQWLFRGFSFGHLNFALAGLIFFERNEFGRQFGVRVVLNFDITSRRLDLRFVGIASMFYVDQRKLKEN